MSNRKKTFSPLHIYKEIVLDELVGSEGGLFVLRKAALPLGAASKDFPGGVQMQKHRLGMETLHGECDND